VNIRCYLEIDLDPRVFADGAFPSLASGAMDPIEMNVNAVTVKSLFQS